MGKEFVQRKDICKEPFAEELMHLGIGNRQKSQVKEEHWEREIDRENIFEN